MGRGERMSTMVLDVLYVKMIEKTIRRQLNNEDMSTLRDGEPIFVRDYRGMWMSFRAPSYRFPYDVMPKDTDARAISEQSGNGDVFEYAFTNGPLVKVSRG